MAKSNAKEESAAEKKKKAAVSTEASERKQKINGLLLLVGGIFLFLSIISYSPADIGSIHFNVSEIIGLQSAQKAQGQPLPTIYDGSGSAAAAQHHGIDNWFGIWGAYISHFFVNNTIGVLSIIFPCIMLLWAYGYFFPLETRKKINISTFLLFNALGLSTFLGLFFNKGWLFEGQLHVPGRVGAFNSRILIDLTGAFGTILLLLTAFTIVYVFAFDMKFEVLFHMLHDKFVRLADKDTAEDEDEKPAGKKSREEKNLKDSSPKENGAKDNSVKDKLKKKLTKAEQPQQDEPAEEPAQTTIRINKSDTTEPPETKKKGKDKKQGTPASEQPESAALPNEPLEPEISPALEKRQGEEHMPEPWDEQIQYKLPSIEILDPIPPESFSIDESELRKNAEQLKEKLALFDIKIDDIEVTPGPVVTLYEIKPAPGVKISRIVSLENDIALALAARGIRIIAPIPGKSVIGVEIPNQDPSKVASKAVLTDITRTKAELPLALGKTIGGEVYVTDLSKMPHLLVAGSTGSGKSVGINMMIATLLFARYPYQFKMAIIDPKKIELSFYQKLRQHYLAICPDIDEDIVTVPMNAVILLKSVELEMEKRYDMLAKAGVRNIIDYNIKIADPAKAPKDTSEVKHHYLPYIVVVIDELADLMITAGKEVEEPIARLAQLARAVGIHLILATQRPSVNVITGVIKANFSTRISYQVATKIDSRTILDMNGAEQLLGKGDMLFLPPGCPKPIRLQNAFISTDEVERLTDEVEKQPGYSKPYYLPSIYEKKQGGGRVSSSDLDPLFEDAAKIVVQHQQGSVSLLQRRLKLGYARAARIVDQLEEAGIVGPNDGSKARLVLVDTDEMLETILRNL